ncbi:MAG: transglutaminase domain-containing protein [Marinilabiliaceae bacterium]|nr:transglutaminase domain-containing protein [Marinilabiliaceae bacterium]
MKRIFCVFSILMLILSCSGEKSLQERVEQALEMAGENRMHLEAVVNYCKDDTLKLLCANYLIAQMPLYHYYEGPDMKAYYEYFRLYSKGNLSPEEVAKQVAERYGQLHIGLEEYRRDVERVDSTLLIENIDYAVRVYREMKWSKSVKLEDFLEYILPYKIDNEEPSKWRKRVYETYQHLFDGKEIDDPIEAAQIVLDTISQGHIYFTNMFPLGPHLGDRVLRWRSGGCREYTDLATYVMRALGIPCAIDYMPMRGDNNVAHFWNVIIGKEGRELMFEFPTREMKEMRDFWCRKGKVYRQLYSQNDSLYRDLRRGGNKSFPQNFLHPRIKDVTAVYADTMNRDVVFPVEEYLYEDVERDKPVFLCLSSRREWIPVAWSWIEEGELKYRDVDGFVVFGLAQYENGVQKMVSDPLFVDKYSDEIRRFEPQSEIDTLTLYYKFHLYNEIHIVTMKGSFFEASNDPDFRHSDTLYVCNDPIERLYNTVYTHNSKRYRYFRYYSNPWTFGNIAEIAVYENEDDSVRTMGEIIGLPGAGTEEETRARWAKAFDGDPYASFNHTEGVGAWVGLKFDRPTKIEKIVFAPRNLDNFIRRGDQYELFYFDNHDWQSTGDQVATSDSIQFCAPRGSLLYLKNHTRGVDERIFEMVDGKQAFR